MPNETKLLSKKKTTAPPAVYSVPTLSEPPATLGLKWFHFEYELPTSVTL